MEKEELKVEELIKKNLAKLKGYVFSKTDNPQEAEEIIQETLISALYSYSSFKEKSSFFTWLCGIANHEISDFYRKKKIKTFLFSRLPWLEDLVSEALGPEQVFLKKEYEEKINYTLNKLSEGYREVLRLKYYQGLSVLEISQRLNETVKAIESRLTRARAAFSKAFAAEPF